MCPYSTLLYLLHIKIPVDLDYSILMDQLPPIIDKLAFIYIKDKKLLVTRSQGKDVWYIPGGKREANETDSLALIREVMEELNVDLIAETIQHYGDFKAQADGKPEGVMVHMTCYTAEFMGSLQPSSEIEELGFFGYDEKNKTSAVDQLIFDDLKNRQLID